jgi:hypothetical protein
MDYRKVVEETRKLVLKKLLVSEEEADKLTEEIVKKIQKELKPDLSNLDELIDKYLEDYANKLSDKLFQSIKEAAEIGFISKAAYQTFLQPQEQEKENLVSKVAEEIINLRYPDGLNLSERVWNWKKELRKGLKRTLLNQVKLRSSAQKIAYELRYTIEQLEKGKFTVTMVQEQLPKLVKELHRTARLSIANGGDLKEWRKLAKKAEKYINRLTDNIQYGLKPAYKKLIDDLTEAIKKRSEKAVDEAVKWWVYDKQQYRLKVIARTEMSNAYYLSIIKSTQKNPLVVGYRWKLSRSHRIRDICDDLAHKDHGLGLPGVFPKDRVPMIQSLASHPQCLCRIEPVMVNEVKGMDKIKRTQIQVRTILRDYANIFADLESQEDLVERFRKSFPTPRTYWSHIFRHAIPQEVLEKYSITNWKKAMAHSKEIFPYQVEYAKIALDALSFPHKVALIEEKNNPINKIIIMSKRKNVALLLETTGAFASAYKLDKFKNWEEWLAAESKRNYVLEVPIDEEIRKLAKRIRNNCKGYL